MIWLRSPDFADVFVRGQAAECLETACIIVGIKEVAEMVAKLIVTIVVIPFIGFVAQIGWRTFYPLPQTDLAYWLSDGYAKSSVAVEDRDTDLDLCDLPIEIPRHQRLAE